jgi:plasmid maintenance system killer protein
MIIMFINQRLEKLFNSDKKLNKKYGSQSKRIKQRLNALRAAETLEDMKSMPGRCHSLTGDRKGQWSLDLKHPYRLIFEPANEPIPRLPDGRGVDQSRVTAICIIGVEDTHE